MNIKTNKYSLITSPEMKSLMLFFIFLPIIYFMDLISFGYIISYYQQTYLPQGYYYYDIKKYIAFSCIFFSIFMFIADLYKAKFINLWKFILCLLLCLTLLFSFNEANNLILNNDEFFDFNAHLYAHCGGGIGMGNLGACA